MPRKPRTQEVYEEAVMFGQRVAAARRNKAMTQSDLAEKTGVHLSHIQRIEAGSSQPTVEVLKNLASALGVSADELVFDQVRETAARRLMDVELLEQFAAIENLNEADKQAIKTVLNAMIVKQRVESAITQPTTFRVSN